MELGEAVFIGAASGATVGTVELGTGALGEGAGCAVVCVEPQVGHWGVAPTARAKVGMIADNTGQHPCSHLEFSLLLVDLIPNCQATVL